MEITEKIKKNAMAVYGLPFLNIAFLYSKNKDLNHPFIKTHAKVAILIHLGLLINTIIFARLGLGIKYDFYGYKISDIIAIIIYLILFVFIIIGVYKAYNLQKFSLGESISFEKKNIKIIDINNNGTFSEKDKLTILFSLFPLIGYIIYPRYKNNKIIKNNFKLNSVTFFIILFLFIFGNNNLANLLFLLYIVFIGFYGMYIFVKNEVLNFYLDFIPNFESINIFFITLYRYLKFYISNSPNFKDFKSLYKDIFKEYKQNKFNEEILLKKNPNFRLNKYLIYIPFLNLITLFDIKSKYKKHIINGFLITLFITISILLDYIYKINYNYILLLLIPIFLGIGYLKVNKLNYEIIGLFYFYKIYLQIKNFISKSYKKILKIKNTEKKLNLKIEKKKELNIK